LQATGASITDAALNLNLYRVKDVRSEMAATRSGTLWKTETILLLIPLDSKRAEEAIQAARAAGASRDDFEKEMVWYIYKNVTAEGMVQSHIKDQVKRLHKMRKA
jgi:hypothetical protein